MMAITPLLLFALVMFLLPVSLVLTSMCLAPHKPNPVKCSTYECGEVPVGSGRTRFVMQYFAYAIVFTIIDVLATFLFVCSIAFMRLGVGLLTVLAFVVIVGLSLVYSWRAIER
jgi:NADH-quinone oxidoreductase subunit A